MAKQPLLLKNATIYADNEVIENGFIYIENHQIKDIGHCDHLPHTEEEFTVTLPKSCKVIPGMIDVHIHGANGSDVMDGTEEALNNMANILPQEGTTSFLATTMTQNNQAIENALENVGRYIKKQGQYSAQAEILGVHLEGPFINKEKAGAQPIEHIQHPDIEQFKKWNEIASQQIRLVTLAPEEKGALDLIRYLNSNGIIPSVGHSDATYHQVMDAMKEGLSHVTHLYNQMRGFHHREPGIVGAAWLEDDLMVELISDGIHATPEAVQSAYLQTSSERLILITDAMRAKCLKNGTYDLGGQSVTVKGQKAVLHDGTLAGSTLRLGHAFQNILTYTNCTIREAIEMTSANAAKELGINDRKGSIAKGKDADLVVLDKNHEVILTLCRGSIAYDKEGQS
ncbi:N-acetylglucosamine-6-phosphate deacetylase [Gracilibacillus sp. YIM 98692]|uniref:N-acetylglucosamine-6-phosphate deacetylase n=1 Tax=Gracilibacillus sp. YIM 98692 TaxID=2663532 RepID=UPI0013D1890A|nr:N-acetylglucosamine-6-phosphate deacetylase [Gracilibacillus sp. YIM 98692]